MFYEKEWRLKQVRQFQGKARYRPHVTVYESYMMFFSQMSVGPTVWHTVLQYAWLRQNLSSEFCPAMQKRPDSFPTHFRRAPMYLIRSAS